MSASMPESGTLRSQSRFLSSIPWENGRLVVEKELKHLLADVGSMASRDGPAGSTLSTNGS